MLSLIKTDQYTDLAIGQIHTRELDEGRYLCSMSTMYRIAKDTGQGRERRRPATHPAKEKPELLADQPSQVWSFARSHSRPRVSNDNTYSEAQFRTFTYLPDFPGHFGSLQHAKQFLTEFFYQLRSSSFRHRMAYSVIGPFRYIGGDRRGASADADGGVLRQPRSLRARRTPPTAHQARPGMDQPAAAATSN